MAFIPQDLYLSSGLGSIINSWTPDVSKFDTSTFYNWEEDNEPLYDLDERSEFLWEKLGYPIANGFSGVPGKMFVVSGDALFAGEYSSIGGIPVFKHLSSVIAVLPSPLTYPAIIEVASFGALGELKLSNLKIDPNCVGAGLEIINRNFGRSNTLSSTIYRDVSSIYSPEIVGTLHQACSLALSVTVASGFYDQRWNLNNRVWMSRAPAGSATGVVTNRAILSIDKQNFDLSSSLDILQFSEYGATEDNSTSADMVVTRDVDSVVVARAALAANDALHALVYGNFLSKVSVNNCAGPIYIRGFVVDGGTGTGGSLAHTTSAGFEINNSELFLENCLAIRCRDFGFKIVNSDVTLSRSLAAGRIYGFGATPAIRDSTRGVGLHATNSVLRVRDDSYAEGSKCLIQTSLCSKGMELINSTIREGASYDGSDPTSRTFIQSFFNIGNGIEVNNTTFDHLGHLEVFNNHIGLDSTASKINLPTVVSECNKLTGIRLRSSSLVYNNLKVLYNDWSTYGNYESLSFSANGQHIHCDDSSFLPALASSMPSIYGKATFLDSFGLTDESGGSQLASLDAINGSRLELVHTICRTIQDSTFTNNQSVVGACVYVKDNSVLKLKGSVSQPTIFVGPKLFSNQAHVAILAADDNSDIEICGPTLIGQGAVDVLVENQSMVRLAPHNIDDRLDHSGWDLSNPKNHTRVELHSTRACLVANNCANIIMEDMGDYNSFWPADAITWDYNDGDGNGIQVYTSGGFCQFYPNGQDEAIVNALNNDDLSYAANPFDPLTFTYTNGYFLTDYTATSAVAQLSSVSTGGLCVVAANNSLVRVLNVHFPTGWTNTSGYWYDINTVPCDQLRIWNIGEGSHLEAAFLSVSGNKPGSSLPYYGPSGVYTSGAGGVAFGVPSLPDTGTLSVLDQFGKTSTASPTNYGPFRLYVSPGSKAKMMKDVTSQAYGPPYQVWAQGYNTSGNVSGDAMFSGMYSGINASQFIHVSSILDSSFKDRIRLDESGANTFANARHCASNTSGRVPVVTIYRASQDAGGIGYDTNVAGMGQGFKSADTFDLKRDN